MRSARTTRRALWLFCGRTARSARTCACLGLALGLVAAGASQATAQKVGPQPSQPSLAEPGEPAFDEGEGLALDLGDLSASFGVTAGAFSAAPNVIGDFFGGGSRLLTATDRRLFQFHTNGFIVSGAGGSANATLVYEANGGVPNDFFSSGLGTDQSGDGNADVFAITEPLPPNEVPTAPGPGFLFDGGTVTYTDSPALTTPQDGVFADGDLWFASYSYSQTFGPGQTGMVVFPGPGVGVRRVKIAENGSPEPRDRVFFSYSYFNDVIAGFGDVSRYVLGIERTFLCGTMSWEIRLPMAGTVGSDQPLTAGRAARSYELGNAMLALKAVLWETDTTLYTMGLGMAFPTADDARLMRGPDPIMVIDNRAVQLLPYGAMIWIPRERLFVQGFVQLDVAANGNPVAGDASGQSLPRIGVFQDTPLMFVDLAASYLLYDCPHGRRLTRILPSLELHYSTTLRDADVVSTSGLLLTDVSRRYDVLNLTLGAHLSFINGIVVSPAMSIPLRDGDDEQYDYEAQVQLNWYF